MMMARQEKLTEPGAALLRPPIPPAEANIRFSLSILGSLSCYLVGYGVMEVQMMEDSFKKLTTSLLLKLKAAWDAKFPS